MANTETTPATWEIRRLFLLPDGDFISRTVDIVQAADRDKAIEEAALKIKGIAILKARKLNRPQCPVCGQPITKRTCKPTRQAYDNGQDAQPM